MLKERPPLSKLSPNRRLKIFDSYRRWQKYILPLPTCRSCDALFTSCSKEGSIFNIQCTHRYIRHSFIIGGYIATCIATLQPLQFLSYPILFQMLTTFKIFFFNSWFYTKLSDSFSFFKSWTDFVSPLFKRFFSSLFLLFLTTQCTAVGCFFLLSNECLWVFLFLKLVKYKFMFLPFDERYVS